MARPTFPRMYPCFYFIRQRGSVRSRMSAVPRLLAESRASRRLLLLRLRGESFQFLTAAQVAYVEHYAEVLGTALDSVEPGEQNEVVIDMDAIVDAGAPIPKPASYYPGTGQQTCFTCVQCKTKNDIRGRFGYCCACGCRNNIAELRSQIEIIRSDLNDARVAPEESVKRIVSAFDACCRDFVAQLATLPMRNRRREDLQQLLFHGIDAPSELLKRAFDIEILRGLDADLGFLRMMFQRRHVYEHEAGVATRRYIAASGDTAVKEGALIRETRENAHRLAGGVVRIATNLEAGFSEILPGSLGPAKS
jgi:hypothetical protein